MSLFREKIINAIENSCECTYEVYVEKLIAIQTLNYMFDKFQLDEYYENQSLTHKEYKKYFKPIVKKHMPWLHNIAKLDYKKEKQNEIKKSN